MAEPRDWTTPDGRAKLQCKHVPMLGSNGRYCDWCRVVLPCPTLQLLAALEEAERRVETREELWRLMFGSLEPGAAAQCLNQWQTSIRKAETKLEEAEATRDLYQCANAEAVERADAAEALVRRLGKSLLCLNTSDECSVRAAQLAKWNAPICDCWPCILYASIPRALREEGT